MAPVKVRKGGVRQEIGEDLSINLAISIPDKWLDKLADYGRKLPKKLEKLVFNVSRDAKDYWLTKTRINTLQKSAKRYADALRIEDLGHARTVLYLEPGLGTAIETGQWPGAGYDIAQAALDKNGMSKPEFLARMKKKQGGKFKVPPGLFPKGYIPVSKSTANKYAFIPITSHGQKTVRVVTDARPKGSWMWGKGTSTEAQEYTRKTPLAVVQDVVDHINKVLLPKEINQLLKEMP